MATKKGVVPEIDGAAIVLEVTNVRYRIVTDGGRGRIILDDIDMLIRHVRARGWHVDGIYENKATRPELQGHPVVKELSGPTWWADGFLRHATDAWGEIFGDVPNIAARVQALAEPGAVVVTARVQRQIAGLFVAEERGSHELKGVPEPVTLFRVIRASGGGRRAGQRHLTPLVGRDEEIAILMRRWERARQLNCRGTGSR